MRKVLILFDKFEGKRKQTHRYMGRTRKTHACVFQHKRTHACVRVRSFVLSIGTGVSNWKRRLRHLSEPQVDDGMQ